MNLSQSILLGIVQGLTEFLPVSSSGHLVIAQKLIGIPSNITFDVAVHLSTLLAVILYFWKDLFMIISHFFKGLRKIAFNKEFFRSIYYSDTNFKIAILIIVGTAPTALIGLILKSQFEKLFNSILAVGFFFILTGIIILIAEWIGKGERREYQLNIIDALIIGTAQGAAIAPGLSRMGTTISAALSLNLERRIAAKFSFLLSAIAILGAGILKAGDLIEIGSTGIGLISLILGSVASALTGYLVIKILMNIIQKTSIRVFAYYCFAVGLITIIWSMVA